MTRVTISAELQRILDEARSRANQQEIESDRHARALDRLPKLRQNTRKKLAHKRAQDRLEFQKRIDIKRGRGYAPDEEEN